MTREKIDAANGLVQRINRLQTTLDAFKSRAEDMDSSLVRLTGFYIWNDTTDFGTKDRFSTNINQGELLFLIEAFEKEIERLEQELAAL